MVMGIDVNSHGDLALTGVKSDQNKLPPILAIVSVTQREKTRLFHLGACDYISAPLILPEFNYRVIGAIQNYHQQSTDHSNKEPYTLAEKTAQYLHQMLENPVSLQQIAKEMGTNRNKLSREFKLHFGTSVFAWLRQQRMNKAAELLSNTAFSIDEISYQVGYPKANNFSTTFKLTFGRTPFLYRKMQQTDKTMP